MGGLFWGEGIKDDGWRQFAPSDIRRMYTDLGFKNSDAEFHFDFTRADNFVGVEGASPVQLLNLGWNKIFTNGGTTNQLAMESGNATINATDNLSFAAVGYYRHFIQSHFDANISDAADCGPGPEAGTVCIDGAQALDQTGNPIPTPSNPALGETDRTGEDARSYGTSLQAVEKAQIFGHSNRSWWAQAMITEMSIIPQVAN